MMGISIRTRRREQKALGDIWTDGPPRRDVLASRKHRGATLLSWYRGQAQGEANAYSALRRKFPEAASYLKERFNI